MKNPLCAVLALMLLATACATTRLRTEFDIYEGLCFTYLAIGTSATRLTATSQLEPRSPSAGVATVPDQERIASPARASVDASPSPASIRETPSPSERTTASAEPSFAQRVREFFTGLFSR